MRVYYLHQIIDQLEANIANIRVSDDPMINASAVGMVTGVVFLLVPPTLYFTWSETDILSCVQYPGMPSF